MNLHVKTFIFILRIVGIPLFLSGQTPNETGDTATPELPADGLIRTIQPAREYSAPSLWLWIIPLAAICGLLLLWLLFRYLHQRRKKRDRTRGPTPYQIARTALLDTQKIKDTGDPKRFATAISQCVRNFIEQAFHLPAPERTTEEFLPEIQEHPVFQGELSDRIGELLALCDLAKFARRQFGENEMEQLYHVAGEIIDKAHLQLIQSEERARSGSGDGSAGKPGVSPAPSGGDTHSAQPQPERASPS